jgi:hypothetical protein
MEGSSWHQERVGIPTGGSGLEGSEEASTDTTAALKRTKMAINERPCG